MESTQLVSKLSYKLGRNTQNESHTHTANSWSWRQFWQQPKTLQFFPNFMIIITASCGPSRSVRNVLQRKWN